MAFVYETIPEKDWGLFNSWKLKNTQGDLMILKEGIAPKSYCYYAEKDWIADREREIYFVYLGGQNRGQFKVNALIWKGIKIIVTFQSKVTYAKEHSASILYYDVLEILAPKILNLQKAEIVSIVNEVIEAKIYCNPNNKNIRYSINNVADPKFLDNVDY